ncbi:aminoglycoside phosphotransferase family protein [Saccharothrix algeriensis]
MPRRYAVRNAPRVQMHADQLTVTPAAVGALVVAQFPQWDGLTVTALRTQGTVNAIFRIGERITARFPLQPGEAAEARRHLEAEAEAARELAAHTRYAVPEPVAIGEPGAGYPMPWSVQTWVPGVTATDDDPADSTAFAHDLAAFITEVRAIDTRGRRFNGRGRGGELRTHDGWVQTCLDRSEPLFDVPRLRELWARWRELPRGDDPDVMNHGDLIPGNVLVSGGRLAGLLDVGGLGPADPALDLVSAWHLLEAGPRQTLREALGCDAATWERGKAWAFQQAIGAAWYYADTNPAMSLMGRRTIARILAAEPS